MTIETIKQLFAYHQWANAQVWASLAKASEEQFAAEHDYSVGSLQQQTFHVMQSDWWAVTMLTDGDMSQSPKIEDFPTLDSLREKSQAVDAQFIACLDSVGSLDRMISIPLGGGKSLEMSLGDLLMSSINHGTNHRAQMLALLHKHGLETCEQGYFFFVMARQKEASA